jgi:hypothetical protein
MFERPHHQRIEQTLCSIVNGAGMAGLMSHAMAVLREPRIDQYGIRCVLQVEAGPTPAS